MTSTGTVRAYLRISKRTDESQSIEQQRYKIQRWAGYQHEHMPLEWYEDEGVSATKRVRRPQRDRAVSELRQGDVLVALKVDRMARSVRDLLDIIETAEERGASVVFVEQGIDTSGAYGKFTIQLLGALAELEAAIIRERVTAAQETFGREGRHGYGLVPFGFRSVKDPGRGGKYIEPDPEAGPILREAVEAVIGGASVQSVADRLGMPGNTLRKLMHNPRLYGRQPGGKLDRDAALLSMSEWRALRAQMDSGPKSWGTAPGYGPVLACHVCDQRLYLNRSNKREHGGSYTCAGRHAGRPTILRDVADGFLEGWFLGFQGAGPEFIIERDNEDDTERREQLALVDQELDEVLAQLRNARGDDRVTLTAAMARLQDEHDAIDAEPTEGEARLVPSGRTTTEVWADSTDAERTFMLRQSMRVVVHPARPARQGGRFEVVDKDWPEGSVDVLRERFGAEFGARIGP